MYEILLIAFLVVALLLIGLVLIQQGKGADMGSSFGAGSSNTMFGSSGSGNFLTKLTAVLATAFFVLSLILGNLSSRQTKKVDEWENLDPTTAVEEQTLVPASEDVPSAELPAASQEDVPAVNNETETSVETSDVPN